MKKTILTTLLLLPVLSFSQFSTPEIYGELGGFYNPYIDDDSFAKFSAGVELFSYKFISPEIDFNFYFGADQSESYELDETTLTPNYREFFDTRFQGVVIGFAPKIYFRQEDSRWVFIPKYNIGTAHGWATFTNSEGVTIEKSSKARTSFWSYALGIEIDSWSEVAKFGLYIIYTDYDGDEGFQGISFEEQGYDNIETHTKSIGLSLRLSYNFKNKNPDIN